MWKSVHLFYSNFIYYFYLPGRLHSITVLQYERLETTTHMEYFHNTSFRYYDAFSPFLHARITHVQKHCTKIHPSWENGPDNGLSSWRLAENTILCSAKTKRETLLQRTVLLALLWPGISQHLVRFLFCPWEGVRRADAFSCIEKGVLWFYSVTRNTVVKKCESCLARECFCPVVKRPTSPNHNRQGRWDLRPYF